METSRQDLQWTEKKGRNRRRKNYTRQERKNQIEHVVMEHLYMHRKAMSMMQIAKAVDMTPSMHLTRILEDMVDDGLLVFKRFDYNGGKCKYRFEYTIPPQKLAAGMAGAMGVGGGES